MFGGVLEQSGCYVKGLFALVGTELNQAYVIRSQHVCSNRKRASRRLLLKVPFALSNL